MKTAFYTLMFIGVLATLYLATIIDRFVPIPDKPVWSEPVALDYCDTNECLVGK